MPCTTTPSKPYPLEKEKEKLASTEDTPTLPELINFKTQSSSISIIREIGVLNHLDLLGPVLLKDDDGRVTDAIKNQYHHNATLINPQILKMWLKLMEQDCNRSSGQPSLLLWNKLNYQP